MGRRERETRKRRRRRRRRRRKACKIERVVLDWAYAAIIQSCSLLWSNTGRCSLPKEMAVTPDHWPTR